MRTALWLASAACLVVGCGSSRPAEGPPRPTPTLTPATDPSALRVSEALEREGRVAWEPARVSRVVDEVSAPCEVVAAPDGEAAVSSSVAARVVAWHAAVGDAVRRGAPVVTLEAREVVDLRNTVARESIRAASLEALAREESEMIDHGATSARSLREARASLAASRAAVVAARRTLALLGASESGPGGRFTLHAPLAGVVVRREGVRGAMIEPVAGAATLAVIADLSAARALAQLPEAASDVAVGARAWVTLRGGGAEVEGRVVWRDPSLSAATRTRAVHISLPEGAPRALAQTGTARVEREGGGVGVSVPVGAVYREAERTYVFVRRGAGAYEPRAVTLGRGAARVEVTEGLRDGEPVVVAGVALVAAEFSRRRDEAR
ncbi:MAG: efflux RND transporter periplasmic adaptor subunit [Polyangiales bacterium]